jgi:ribonuclease HI
MPLTTTTAKIYTDGSCHTQLCAGAWAAILLKGDEKKVLTGTAWNTTNNRMELTAVIKAIEYVLANYPYITTLTIFSDSQYVTGLPARKEKLIAVDFNTKKGNELQNADLVKMLFKYFRSLSIEFIKIKAHQKLNGVSDHNVEADKLSRKLVRDMVKEK